MGKVLEWCKPGATVEIYMGEGNPNNEVRYIRAIVDDEWVVYRIRTQNYEWQYHVDHAALLSAHEGMGYIRVLTP